MPDKVRFGILGCADIASTFVRAAAASRNAVVHAVASRDAGKARAWSEERAIPLHHASYDDLLASRDVEAVYIPLPNSLHAEWTMKALAAGKPVLCEKPLAADATQARAVEDAARRAHLPVMEGFMYRHHPIYERVFAMIREGEIGRIATIHSEFIFMLEDRSAIPASAHLAGGALMDVGCYCVHLSRMIAGCEPDRVCAFERRSEVDDLLVGMMDFPNGIMAQFETGIAAAERQRARITGTKGALVLKSPWHPGTDEARIILARWGQPDEVHVVKGADAYVLQIEEFADAVSGRAPLRRPLSDAVANMAVIDALYRSAATGQVAIL